MFLPEGRPWLAGVLSACAALSAAAAHGGERQWHALPVAGGPAALAGAAGLPRGLPAWRVLYEAARRTHGIWGEESRGSGPAGVGVGAGESPPPGAAVVPLPLAPRQWRHLLRRHDLEDGRLAFAILADRRSSLLYRGLAGLDDETLSALAAEPGVLWEIHNRHAEVLAAFGGRFRVRDGGVVVPGGAGAPALWEGLLGESAREPARFLAALLAASGGRMAFLYDSVSRLDPARQRFALGLDTLEGKTAGGAFRELAAVFDREPAWWRREGGSFARPEADAARLLREVRLDADGHLGPPASRAFWVAVFDGEAPRAGAAPLASAPSAGAAWLAGRIGTGDAPARRLRLSQLAFAQRALAEVGAESLPDAVLAVQGLRDAPALVLALERMGTRDPALFARGVRAARRASSAPRDEAGPLHPALQGLLAVVDRARFARTLDAAAAERLAGSLFEVPFEARGSGPRALAAWTETVLLPELARAVYGDRPAGEPETTVLRAVAGDGVGGSERLAVVEWEGLFYRADLGRAELTRLERARARQGGAGLGRALRACREVPAEEGQGEDACAAVLGAALASIVYAAHLGDPEGPALAGEDPSRRHDFGARPWALPEEVSGPGVPWHVQGSLLGLERALARLSLHRLDGEDLPDGPPVLDAAHRRGLAAAVVLANPRERADADRDALAAAIEAGRRRVASAGPRDADALALDAGLEPWRARAFAWMVEHEPQARASFFSLGELLDLGAPGRGGWDGWGVADEVAVGLGVRLPRALPADEAMGRVPEPAVAAQFVDLDLRVAEHLARRGLPARLSPSVVASLLPDLLSEARPIAPDDRAGLDAWVRALPGERIDDAVASLAGRGPLQPAPRPGNAR
jgi:hypothetical protein